jgi:predicted Na+-dependent transporter
MFNADLALSVTMTAISTILSVVALPVNLILYANISYEKDITSDIDWSSVFIALAIVITAIALGLYMSYRSHSYKFNILANKVCFGIHKSWFGTRKMIHKPGFLSTPSRLVISQVSF